MVASEMRKSGFTKLNMQNTRLKRVWELDFREIVEPERGYFEMSDVKKLSHDHLRQAQAPQSGYIRNDFENINIDGSKLSGRWRNCGD